MRISTFWSFKFKLSITLLIKRISFLFLFAVLSACGGGGGSANAAPIAIVDVGGTFKFQRAIPHVSNGLEPFSTTQALNTVPGAIVELLDVSESVLQSSKLDSDGKFNFRLPAGLDVKVRVRAALGDPASPHTSVKDNTSGNLEYSFVSTVVNSGNQTLALSLVAETGWNDGLNTYIDERSAAPFAILEVVAAAQNMINSVEEQSTWFPLSLYWSKDNRDCSSNSLDYSNGYICSTHFTNDAIYILGKSNEDTDEFDWHVVAHEWAHYFEKNFSRLDAVTGLHTGLDILDVRVAFSEGFAVAFSSMLLDYMGVANPHIYLDTNGPNNGSIGVTYDLEADTRLDSIRVNDVAGNAVPTGDNILLDGVYSEVTVMELFWDIYDSANDTEALELGFAPLYSVMTGPQRSSEAFVSMNSFLTYLKADNAALGSQINSLAVGENIILGNSADAIYEEDSPNYPSPLYINVTPDGSVVSGLATNIVYGGIISSGDVHLYNKLYNQVYVRARPFPVADTACYSLTVRPDANDDLIIVLKGGAVHDVTGASADEVYYFVPTNTTEVFSVSNASGSAGFSVDVSTALASNCVG